MIHDMAWITTNSANYGVKPWHNSLPLSSQRSQGAIPHIEEIWRSVGGVGTDNCIVPCKFDELGTLAQLANVFKTLNLEILKNRSWNSKNRTSTYSISSTWNAVFAEYLNWVVCWGTCRCPPVARSCAKGRGLRSRPIPGPVCWPTNGCPRRGRPCDRQRPQQNNCGYFLSKKNLGLFSFSTLKKPTSSWTQRCTFFWLFQALVLVMMNLPP